MSAQPGPRTKGKQRSHNRHRPAGNPVPGLSVRTRAADAVYRVLSEGKALDSAFDASAHKGEHTSADRALTKALVLTTLRRLATLDAAIDTCLDKPLDASAAKTMAILRVMAAQLLVMEMADHAAVTLAVEDAARRKDTRKLKGLVNAVGRRMVREKDALIAEAPPHDLPAWLMERWGQTYGAEKTFHIAAILREQPAIDLTLKPNVDRPALIKRMSDHSPIALHRHAVRLIKPGSIEALPGYQDGTWWVQDIAASLPAQLLLDALPDPAKAAVLDLCAAPGGKTAQLASAGCTVTALDQSAARMSRLSDNMTRLGLKVQTVVSNALTDAPKGRFDGVLLDAPCSATGTLRRNPDIAHIRRDTDIVALAKIQASLLAKAAERVKPGGVMVYATCSLEPEEGEAQIARFLRTQKGWTVIPITKDQALHGSVQGDGTMRTLPHFNASNGTLTDATGMDGFFAAVLRAPD